MRGLCALRGVFISVLEALSEFCEHICIYAIHRAVLLDPVTLVCYITEAHENYRKVVQADSGKTGPSRVTSHVIHKAVYCTAYQLTAYNKSTTYYN